MEEISGDHIADDDSFVEIGDGAFLGYGAVILPNVRVGERAIVGAEGLSRREGVMFQALLDRRRSPGKGRKGLLA